MAHFAELYVNNEVKRVLTVNNEVLLDEDGIEQEQKGIDFLTDLFGGIWKQASVNATFRKNYPGPGYIFNPDLDAFISPKCHSEASLNEETCQWECNNSKHN
jgi:hypothetical protein